MGVMDLESEVFKNFTVGCKWEWLTVQKPVKKRARTVGLCGRTLKSRLSVEILELERDGLRYV